MADSKQEQVKALFTEAIANGGVKYLLPELVRWLEYYTSRNDIDMFILKPALEELHRYMKAEGMEARTRPLQPGGRNV